MVHLTRNEYKMTFPAPAPGSPKKEDIRIEIHREERRATETNDIENNSCSLSFSLFTPMVTTTWILQKEERRTVVNKQEELLRETKAINITPLIWRGQCKNQPLNQSWLFMFCWIYILHHLFFARTENTQCDGSFYEKNDTDDISR